MVLGKSGTKGTFSCRGKILSKTASNWKKQLHKRTKFKFLGSFSKRSNVEIKAGGSIVF
jgi:hypothetical protein